ncbi:hypothetical protein [Stutzerimonas stutzeri]|uniref:hypothetical protein n=1 Tax=Stutzerimonas stutzeri TaxID=316 RepID=UPI001CFCECC5|nr:hypothetical protein [Stutzerimonas stutzeri]
MITGLILAGVFLLVGIVYTIQIVEKGNLEKARKRADLTDRCRRCAELSDGLPGQMMTPALKLLLTRIELALSERLRPLDKGNDKLSGRMQTLQVELAKGEAIEVRNAPRQIVTEAQAKESRFMLEDLHAQIVRATKDGLLDQAEAKRWVQDIQRMLAILHIEFFTGLGKLALQQNQPQRARLAFERGIQHIRRQPAPAPYQNQLKQLEALLAHADALVLRNEVPKTDEPNELTEGMKTFDDEDLWKKNNVY